MLPLFHDIDVTHIKNSAIILDIDGTVTYDSGDHIDALALAKIAELSTQNKVYFCSNTKIPGRIQRLAEKAHIKYIDTLYRKPNKKIGLLIEDRGLRPLVVIGDKYLTDGRLAHKLGANFIKVRRIIGASDSLYIRFSNTFDDLVYSVAKHFQKKHI
jgi:predicted HAD superfamily phosphohydrolase YqeG